MKRDLNLVRRLLLDVDRPAPVKMSAVAATMSECSPAVIAYHVQLLVQAGFLEASNQSTLQRTDYHLAGLTWRGQEVLGLIGDEDIWNQIRARLPVDAGGVPFDVIELYAAQLTRARTEQEGTAPT